MDNVRFVRDEHFLGNDLYKNREKLVRYYYDLYFNKFMSMFEWKGLPDTIRQRDMEMLIMQTGYGVITPHNGKLYCLWGSLGGIRNFAYMPTMAVVANPYIRNINGNYQIYYGYEDDEDYIQADITPIDRCVVIPNDSSYMGLSHTVLNYANRLAETYITRRMVTINSRYMNILYAKDNDAKKRVDLFLKHLENGDLASVFDERENLMQEGAITVLPYSQNAGTARMLTELIECEQYDKAALLNEVGLQANYNMKREAINSNESQLNVDALLPSADDMINTRKKCCELVNKLFGQNWSVEFSSSWRNLREDIERSLASIGELHNENSEDIQGSQGNDEKESKTDSGNDGNGNSDEESNKPSE